MIMFNRILTISALIFATLGFSQVSSASEAAIEEAKVVVYRADSSSKTRRVSMYLNLGEQSRGRLNSGDSLTISQPAGEYTLSSNIKGTKDLLIDLKPGRTYYFHTDLAMRGNRVSVSFVEVEERVANM
jgi:hypothetical protein